MLEKKIDWNTVRKYMEKGREWLERCPDSSKEYLIALGNSIANVCLQKGDKKASMAVTTFEVNFVPKEYRDAAADIDIDYRTEVLAREELILPPDFRDLILEKGIRYKSRELNGEHISKLAIYHPEDNVEENLKTRACVHYFDTKELQRFLDTKTFNGSFFNISIQTHQNIVPGNEESVQKKLIDEVGDKGIVIGINCSSLMLLVLDRYISSRRGSYQTEDQRRREAKVMDIVTEGVGGTEMYELAQRGMLPQITKLAGERIAELLKMKSIISDYQAGRVQGNLPNGYIYIDNLSYKSTSLAIEDLQLLCETDRLKEVVRPSPTSGEPPRNHVKKQHLEQCIDDVSGKNPKITFYSLTCWGPKGTNKESTLKAYLANNQIVFTFPLLTIKTNEATYRNQIDGTIRKGPPEK